MSKLIKTTDAGLMKFARYRSNGIYIVKASGAYKIGKTNNIDTRMNTLQLSNPREVELIIYKKVNNATTKENELLNYFEDKLLGNEWFELTSDEVLDAITIINKWTIPTDFMQFFNECKHNDQEYVLNSFMEIYKRVLEGGEASLIYDLEEAIEDGCETMIESAELELDRYKKLGIDQAMILMLCEFIMLTYRNRIELPQYNTWTIIHPNYRNIYDTLMAKELQAIA